MAIRHFDSSKDVDAATEIAHQVLLSKEMNSVSAAQLAPAAGLSLVAAEEALLSLTRNYPANVSVNDDGELVFHFLDLRRIISNDPPWQIWLRERRERLIFLAVLYLGTPLATLAAYSAIGFAAVVDQSSGAALWASAIFALFSIPPALFLATFSAMLTVGVYGPLLGAGSFAFGIYALFAYDSIIAQFGGAMMMFTGGVMVFWLWYEEMRKIWSGESREVIKKVADFFEEFLLGQRPSWGDDQRRIVKLLKNSGGVITATDLVLEFGMNRADAHSELTRVLLDYGGDIETTDEGAILYHFDAFKGHGRRHVSYTQFDRPQFFTKMKWVKLAIWNSTIAGVLSFVFNPEILVFPGLGTLLSAQSRDAVFTQGLGAWPAVFIGVFLLIRVFGFLKQRLQYRQRLSKIAFIERLRQTTSFTASASDVDSRLLAEFGGTIDEEASSPNGEVRFVFPTIEVELKAVAPVVGDRV